MVSSLVLHIPPSASDTMAIQEQNAASKVKELASRLETTEASKQKTEALLRQEQSKVAELSAQHQADVRQHQDTTARLAVVFQQQAILEVKGQKYQGYQDKPLR